MADLAKNMRQKSTSEVTMILKEKIPMKRSRQSIRD
jgi:hypothetical protein